MTRYPCLGSTYLSSGRADIDEPFELVMECNGGATGDCGWRVVLDLGQHLTPDDAKDLFITSETFLPLHQQHLKHRAEARDV